MLKKKKILASILAISLLFIIGATSVAAQAKEFSQWLYKDGSITFLTAGYNSGGSTANVTVYSNVSAQFYICARDGSADYTAWTPYLSANNPHDFNYSKQPSTTKELKLNGRVKAGTYSQNPKITGYVDFG